MLSRVAEAIYWMSRYVERAENVARFCDVTLSLMLDTPLASNESQWQALVSTTGDSERFSSDYGRASQAAVARFLTTDTGYPNSIISSIAAARENARSVREIISREQWECLNQFHRFIQGAPIDVDDGESLADFYAEVRARSALFQGLTDTTWSHGEGWQFARLGRSIERAEKTSRILDVKYYILLPETTYVGTAYDLVQWSALLSSASASQMYRQRFHETTPHNVVAFLVFDRDFPRSIRHCTAQADDALHAITGSPHGQADYESERLLGRLRSRLDYGTVTRVMNDGLHEYLDVVQTDLNRVSAMMAHDFFGLPAPVSTTPTIDA